MNNSLNRILSVSILSLIGFLICLFSFYLNWFSNLDLFFKGFIASINSKFFTYTALLFHYMFEPVLVLFCLFLLSLYIWYHKHKRESIGLCLFVGISALVSVLMKHFIHRLRPENMLVNETGFSFPSGHSITAVILFGLICYYAIFKFKLIEKEFNKIILYFVSVLFILLIGLSRVYLNVHWFSDVLAGWFLGLFLLSGFLFLGRKKE